MRLFWTMIFVLLAAGGIVVFRQRAGPAAPGAGVAPAVTPAVAPAVTPAAPSVPAAPLDAAEAPAVPAPAAESGVTGPAPAAPVAAAPEPAPPPVDPQALAEAALAEMLPGLQPTGPDGMPVKRILTESAAAPAPAEGEVVSIPENPRFPAAKVVPASILRRPDGSLSIDGRFSVTGRGTAADPYLVPWDLFVSAQETYKPRLGQTKLPQRVVFFDGAHVRLTGYIAFPITAASPQEMLSMLNQWDGCCIGVPPTAYDAVEVRLAAPVGNAERMSVHGTVTGVFKVDPLEDSGWLLGLYLMEEAKLTVDQ